MQTLRNSGRDCSLSPGSVLPFLLQCCSLPSLRRQAAIQNKLYALQPAVQLDVFTYLRPVPGCHFLEVSCRERGPRWFSLLQRRTAPQSAARIGANQSSLPASVGQEPRLVPRVSLRRVSQSQNRVAGQRGSSREALGRTRVAGWIWIPWL